jgi:two-component system, OmpR family, sensor histidine kinase MtrB
MTMQPERSEVRRAVSLRSTLAMLIVIVTALALLVTSALVTLTTILHRTTQDSGASVESVRLAEEAQVDLLLHGRVADALVRADVEGGLKRRLLEARRFVTTRDEALVLVEAGSALDRYIASSRNPNESIAERTARYETAYAALDSLVSINVAQAKAAQHDAARWDRVANGFGIGVGAILLVVTGALVLWLKLRAFEPVFNLAAAMERFGRGDRDVRAPESGPRELREMCRQFNEMASSIETQRQAHIAFMGGVAHDLRNPLGVIKMSVAALESDQRLRCERPLGQTIERIDRQIIRMERMLGDFLDVAKSEAGELELRLDTHDARKIVQEAAALFEGTTQGHFLEVRTPEEVVSIRCDQLRIEQVITNLLSNAIKYSPPGSVIEVALDARADELELSVTDHGVGISEVDRSRLFEPFRRVGQSMETSPGSGLGLFVVRKVVELHGGRIEVRSALGSGSTFRVFLPKGRESVPLRDSRNAGTPLLIH